MTDDKLLTDPRARISGVAGVKRRERMATESNPIDGVQDVRYEPNEKPPLPLSIGLGLQYVALTAASVVLSPALMIGAVGGGEDQLAWVVFAALVVSGMTTVVQVVRVGRIGSGYILLMGSSARLPGDLRGGARTGRRRLAGGSHRALIAVSVRARRQALAVPEDLHVRPWRLPC